METNERIEQIIEEIKLASLAALGLAGSLFASPVKGAEPRGIRNNNPGNIKKTSVQWQGATGHDGSFVKFQTPEDGIRAIGRIFSVYQDKYNLKTVRQLMSRWAPKCENPTDKYVEFVAKKMGRKPDDIVNLKDSKELARLVSAIIEFENGKVPYDTQTIMAGVLKPTAKKKT